MEFLGTLTPEQLWLTRAGDDLRIDLLGTADSVTLEDWYDAGTVPAGRMDRFEASGMVLAEANAQRLVDAMAAWSAGNDGQDGDDLASMPEDPSLANALAAAWQPSAG